MNPIYILIPFTFTTDFYPTLSDPAIRRNVLMDFSAFLKKYRSTSFVLRARPRARERERERERETRS